MLKIDNPCIVGNNAIKGAINRLERNPSNHLSDEDYRGVVKAGWDGQWNHWDDLGGDDPGWGDIGD